MIEGDFDDQFRSERLPFGGAAREPPAWPAGRLDREARRFDEAWDPPVPLRGILAACPCSRCSTLRCARRKGELLAFSFSGRLTRRLDRVVAPKYIGVSDVDASGGLASNQATDFGGVCRPVEHRSQCVRMTVFADIHNDQLPLQRSHGSAGLCLDNANSNSVVALGKAVKNRTGLSTQIANRAI